MYCSGQCYPIKPAKTCPDQSFYWNVSILHLIHETHHLFYLIMYAFMKHYTNNIAMPLCAMTVLCTKTIKYEWHFQHPRKDYTGIHYSNISCIKSLITNFLWDLVGETHVIIDLALGRTKLNPMDLFVSYRLCPPAPEHISHILYIPIF